MLSNLSLLIPISGLRLILAIAVSLALIILLILMFFKEGSRFKSWKGLFLAFYLLILFLMIYTIFSPAILKRQRQVVKQPLIILLDVSKSMDLKRDNDVKKTAINTFFQSKYYTELMKRYDIKTYVSGDSLREGKQPFAFTDKHSRIEEALSLIALRKIPAKNIVLFSDGWFNDEGTGNAFSKESILFALGLGNEREKALEITSIRHEKRVEEAVRLPVVFSFYSRGLDGIDLSLEENGRIIKSEVVKPSAGFNNQVLWVDAPLKGLNKYRLTLSSGNLKSSSEFTILRGEREKKIIILAELLNWDLAFFQRYLREEGTAFSLIDLNKTKGGFNIPQETTCTLYFGTLSGYEAVKRQLGSKTLLWLQDKGANEVGANSASIATLQASKEASTWEIDDLVLPRSSKASLTSLGVALSGWTPLFTSSGRAVLAGQDVGERITLLLNLQDTWQVMMLNDREGYRQLFKPLIRWMNKPFQPYLWEIEHQPRQASPHEKISLQAGLRDRQGNWLQDIEIEALYDGKRLILSNKGSVFMGDIELPEGSNSLILSARRAGRELSRGNYRIDVRRAQNEDEDYGLNPLPLKRIAGSNYYEAKDMNDLFKALLAVEAQVKEDKQVLDITPRLWLIAVILLLLIAIWTIRKLKNLP